MARGAPKKCIRTYQLLFALLPALSFVLQYSFSIRAGTERVMFHHLTVMVVDWALVPFNYFALRAVDWSRGRRLFALSCISVCAVVVTQAYWQHFGLDAGHMITKAGVTLPAGWVHLAFSVMEMTLLGAFVLCRQEESLGDRSATIFATVYFLSMGICGYIMHGRLILSDAMASASGLFFVFAFPLIIRTHPVH